ncbi:hypothetical protein TWF694_003851 [Orbilia ellipsospora]|uniref:Uncharacterized protein n=1 Tax=Orbilia ellipsospora TaxID=2528407 RepID=A0AAV9X0G5_9PEZI
MSLASLSRRMDGKGRLGCGATNPAQTARRATTTHQIRWSRKFLIPVGCKQLQIYDGLDTLSYCERDSMKKVSRLSSIQVRAVKDCYVENVVRRQAGHLYMSKRPTDPEQKRALYAPAVGPEAASVEELVSGVLYERKQKQLVDSFFFTEGEKVPLEWYAANQHSASRAGDQTEALAGAR